jgi:hypothetical protein
VADLKQNFNPFTYQLNIDFSMDTARQLDRRRHRGWHCWRWHSFSRNRGETGLIHCPGNPSSPVSSWTKTGKLAESAFIGSEPAYVVDDDGFKRHIPAEQVDRAVLVKWRR